MQPKNNQKYFGHLYFLNDLIIDKDVDLAAPWLLNDFYDNKWLIKHAGAENLNFNWHRIMPTGIYLTSNGIETCSEKSRIESNSRNIDLGYNAESDYRLTLNKLKKIVFLLAHRRISKRCSFNFHFQFFTQLMALTEWVFLNTDRFSPRENLFELLDTTDLQNEYIPLYLEGGKTLALNLEGRFKAWLYDLLFSIKNDATLSKGLENTLESHPHLSYFDPRLSDWLICSKEEIFLVRAWLYDNNYYLKANTHKGRLKTELLFEKEIHQSIKVESLSTQFQMKLRAFYAIKYIRSQDFSASNLKEYFTSGEQYLDEKAIDNQYSDTRIDSTIVFFDKLKQISKHQISGLPKTVVFQNININNQSFTLKPQGKTKTLPADIALHALGESIHYILTYGDDLVDFAIKVKRELSKSNYINKASLSYLTKYSSKHVPAFLNVPKKLDALNITQLGSVYKSYSLERFNKAGGNARAEIIRQYMGLENALIFLLASIIIIIGATAARRQNEVRTLSDECLEKRLNDGWYLRFELGKDNFGDLRSKQLRCIPNITAKAIKLISRLNSSWQEIHNKKSNNLFFGFTTSFFTCNHLLQNSFDSVLVTFCDYIQMPLDSEGKRWYIKSHQLRRFWAYAFFYKMGLGELSTIGWYLGHSETEHTWAYILESFDGQDKELQQVKASYAADVLQNKHPASTFNKSAISELKNLVLIHFNKKHIKFVENYELENFLENLISTDKFDVQPKFIRDTNGSDYDLIFLLNKNGEIKT